MKTLMIFGNTLMKLHIETTTPWDIPLQMQRYENAKYMKDYVHRTVTICLAFRFCSIVSYL